MANLVCGRCGRRTAPNSTYCSHDKWALFVDVPEGDRRAGEAIAGLEVQRGFGGILARRRLEKARGGLERSIRERLERRIAALEKRAEQNEQDFESQRALGLLAMLQHHWQRAHAHLELAHRVNAEDYETTVNYGITLAQIGQSLPALELLQAARARFSGNPALLLNVAMVALDARRPAAVLDAIDELEGLWSQNAEMAQDFHDEAQTLRGLALLDQGKPQEARAFLEQAARHSVNLSAAGAVRFDLESDAAGGALKPRSDDPANTPDSGPETAGTEAVGATDSGQMEYGSDETMASVEAANEAAAESAAEGNDENFLLANKTADADLLNNLGIAEAASGEFDRALARFGVAMRLEPGNARVHNNLGLLAYGQGQLNLALKHLMIAKQIEEHIEQVEPQTFNHLGVVLSAMGRQEESIEEFQKAGAHERAEFEVWYNLGRAFIEQGKPDRGVEFLRRAFAVDQNDADVHTVLGAAYLLRGQTQLLPEAMKHLKRALQLNPRHRSALADLAMGLLEMGQSEQALRVVQEDVKAHSRGAEALFLLAFTILRMSDENTSSGTARRENLGANQDDQAIARASQLFNRSFDLRPDMLISLYNMALCQYAVGFRESAAKQLEAVVQRDPSIAAAYYLIGVGHADAKRWKEALEAWTTAAHFEPNNSDLQANMGFIYYQRGEWNQAIVHFVRAHNAAPNQADLLGSLGLCYARSNQLTKAIQTFEHALKVQPHAPVTHSNLGLAYYFQKQIERAMEQWRIVSQLDAAYASRREDDQYRNFDDSLVSMRPLNWRSRLIRLAPVLPRPHTRMVAGYNARKFRLAITDPAVAELQEQLRDLEYQSRMLGWMYASK